MLIKIFLERFANMVNSHSSFLFILLFVVFIFLIKLNVIDYGIHGVDNRLQFSLVKLDKR